MGQHLRPVPDFPEYKVARDGSLYSVRKKRFIKPRLDSFKYPRFVFWYRGERFIFWCHRIVASVWCGLKDGQDVHHINGDRWNFSADNLQPLSPKEHIRLHKKGLVKYKRLTKEQAGTPF